ncbi:MAG: hypothetical protein DME45_08470 [Verrucomicrobia bacterium]|nr:MAG: hypothetical protein DME45_08470 [Verrucomicrobiota bacterium]
MRSAVNPLVQFGRFLSNRSKWVVEQWSKASGGQPELTISGNTARQQFADYLPALCQNLAKRFEKEGKTRRTENKRQGDAQAEHRWQSGYKVEEIVRELGCVRQIIAGNCLHSFARDVEEFDASARTEAETLVHAFFDDLVTATVQQFAGEKENDLAASEQNSQAILDSALDCIIVIGDDGRVREWNIAAERLFGYPRERAVGRELVDLIIPPELRARHLAGLGHYRATGEGPILGRRIELPALRADGTRLDVELSITPYRVNDRPVFTAYVRDITERVRSEARRAAQYAIASLISESKCDQKF